jgi:hypothetical protein
MWAEAYSLAQFPFSLRSEALRARSSFCGVPDTLLFASETTALE